MLRYRQSSETLRPIGAGDCKGHASTVDKLDVTASTAHVVTTPLQWACDNVPCECKFEQSITLDFGELGECSDRAR